MNNKTIFLAAIAVVAASTYLMLGGIGVQSADASGPNCPSKGGATTTIDPNAPNAVSAEIPPASQQPIV